MKTYDFYSETTLSRLKKKQNIFKILSLTAAAATVICWMTLLITVSTLTERSYTLIALIINGAGGIAALSLFLNGVIFPGRLIRHAERIAASPKTTLAFRSVSVSKDARAIPHSIEIYTVGFEGEDETQTCFLCASLCKRAPFVSGSGTATLCDRFVVSVSFEEGGV